MPRIVDHDRRRDEIAEAAWRVIARAGIDGATSREIAREAGCSNGVLAHYFADKDAILGHALDVALLRIGERIATAMSGLRGLEALREALVLALPVDEQSRLEVGVLVTFWGRAVGDPALRDRQRPALDAWREVLRRRVAAGVDEGELAAGLDVEATVDGLVALVDGLNVVGVLHRDAYPPNRLIAAVDAHLAALH